MRLDLARSFARILAGLLVAVVGYGIYESPELNWSGFVKTCSSIIQGAVRELQRFVADPFMGLGFMLLLIGFWLIVEGFKNLIFGWRKKTGLFDLGA